MNVITKEEVDFIVFLLIIVGSVVLAIAAIFVTDIMPLSTQGGYACILALAVKM